MEIRFAEKDNRLTMAFIGYLDNASTPEAEKLLERVFMRDDCDILLDCRCLEFISSKGLRLLINLYKHCRDNGHRAFITKMNKNVKEALHLGGFLTLYEEIETE